VPGSPFYVNLLEPYLNNKTFPLRHSSKPGKKNVFSTQQFVPGSH